MSGRIYDECDMLEDMWCCTIAKEQGEEGLYLPNIMVSIILYQQWKYKGGGKVLRHFHIPQGPFGIFKRKQDF